MKIQNYQSLLEKVEKVTKQKDIDLSSGEDLSVGIMNLISIEEHLFFTFGKTKNPKYIQLLDEVRKMRTELLREIIKDYEGEIWCISKHLLAASMRIMEVGTKELKKGNSKRAENLFEKSYQLYSLFWGLNLGAINTKDMSNLKNSEVQDNKEKIFFNNDPTTKNPQPKSQKESVFAKISQIIQKAVDCCKE